MYKAETRRRHSDEVFAEWINYPRRSWRQTITRTRDQRPYGAIEEISPERLEQVRK